jgi:hypothetical protein
MEDRGGVSAVSDTELKTLSEQLTNVRLDLRELSTKMDGIKDVQKEIKELHDTAKEALQSAKSAHHRLDRVDKIHFWAATTIIGAVIVLVITFFAKGGHF